MRQISKTFGEITSHRAIDDEINMYLIKAGDLETDNSAPLEQKGQSQDFETAKQKANKLLKTFAQVEIIESKTKECVYFQTRDSA